MSVTDETCWTSFIGHPTHILGSQPERCYTCAAQQRGVANRLIAAVRRAVDDSLPEWRRQLREAGLNPEATP